MTGLRGARLYLCVDSRARQRDLEQFLDAVLGNGVDVVQLREKGLVSGVRRSTVTLRPPVWARRAMMPESWLRGRVGPG